MASLKVFASYPILDVVKNVTQSQAVWVTWPDAHIIIREKKCSPGTAHTADLWDSETGQVSVARN